MDEALIELIANCRDNLRMAVTYIVDSDAACKVDEAAPFDIPKFRVFSACSVEVAHHADAARRSGILTGLQVFVDHDCSKLVECMGSCMWSKVKNKLPIRNVNIGRLICINT